MGGKYTEAQARATAKYQKEHTEVISVRVKKGMKKKYRSLAERSGGKSLSAYIVDLLDEKLRLLDGKGQDPSRPH